MCYLRSEVLAHRFEGHKSIFDYVVQQTRTHRYNVKLHFGEDRGHREGMNEIRLTRGSHLLFVFLGRKDISAPEQVEVTIRMVSLDRSHHIFEPDHGHWRRL